MRKTDNLARAANTMREVIAMSKKEKRGVEKPTSPASSSQEPQNVKKLPLGLNKRGNQKQRKK